MLTIQGAFLSILNQEGPQETLIFRLCVKPGSKTRICQCPAKFNWLSSVTLYGTVGHLLWWEHSADNSFCRIH